MQAPVGMKHTPFKATKGRAMMPMNNKSTNQYRIQNHLRILVTNNRTDNN